MANNIFLSKVSFLGQPQLKATPQKQKTFNNNVYLYRPNQDTVCFKGISKKEKFDALPQKEKEAFTELVLDIFINTSNQETLLTLIGKKPCTLTSTHKDLNKYKELLTSDEIKIVNKFYISNGNQKVTNPSMLIVNVPLLKKTIENNLDYFRFKLAKPDLNTDGVIEKIFGNDFSKAPIIENDLLGIVLGFPFGDSVLFHLRSYIENHLDFLKDNPDCTKHSIVAEKASTIIRPDLSPETGQYMEENYNKGKAQTLNTEKNINNFIRENLLKGSEWLKNLPIGSSPSDKSDGFFRYFRFHTWDKEAQPIKDYEKICTEGLTEVNSKFKTKEDLVNYILNK